MAEIDKLGYVPEEAKKEIPKDSKLLIPESELMSEETETARMLELFANESGDAIDKDKLEQYFVQMLKDIPQEKYVDDSVVRVDQTEKIVESLLNNRMVVVFVRGFWRVGKTSLLHSVAKKFGQEDSLIIDAGGESWFDFNQKEFEDFKKVFCINSVAKFLEEKSGKKKEEIEKEIECSGLYPLAYLNSQVVLKDKTIFVALDEVIGFVNSKEFADYIDEIRRLTNLHVVVVVHSNVSYEDSFKNNFLKDKENTEVIFPRALTVEEIALMVQKYKGDMEIALSQEALALIHEYTGGMPREVNYFLLRLFKPEPYEDLNLGLSPKKLIYRAKDIQKIIESANHSHIEWPEYYNYRRIFFGVNTGDKIAVSEDELDIMRQIYKNGEIDFAEIDTIEKAQAVEHMVNTMFVYKDEQKGIYRFSGGIVRHFFDRHSEQILLSKEELQKKRDDIDAQFREENDESDRIIAEIEKEGLTDVEKELLSVLYTLLEEGRKKDTKIGISKKFLDDRYPVAILRFRAMSRMFASKYIFLTELGSSETRPEGMYYMSRFNRQFRNKFSIDILSEEKMAEYKNQIINF